MIGFFYAGLPVVSKVQCPETNKGMLFSPLILEYLEIITTRASDDKLLDYGELLPVEITGMRFEFANGAYLVGAAVRGETAIMPYGSTVHCSVLIMYFYYRCCETLQN